VFEPYASFWFRPLVELAITKVDKPPKEDDGTGDAKMNTHRHTRGRYGNTANEQKSSGNFHYFLRDIVLLFLKWQDFVPDNNVLDVDLASEFVLFLMKNAADVGGGTEKKRRLSSNLQLIKLLIEKWKSRLRLKKTVILSFLTSEVQRPMRTGGVGKLRLTVGLQLLAILLANDFPIYDPRVDVTMSEDTFRDLVLKAMNSFSKDIYKAAAEVYGMMLHKQSKFMRGDRKAQTRFQRYDKPVRHTLLGMYKTDLGRFITCLSKIGLHHQQFFDPKTMERVFASLPRIHGDFQTSALHLAYWSASRVPNMLIYLKPVMKRLLATT